MCACIPCSDRFGYFIFVKIQFDAPQSTVSYSIPHKFYSFFGLFFSQPMFRLFLQFPDRKVLDPNGSYISTIQIKIRNDCLSLIS